jgi:hypothetical protein
MSAENSSTEVADELVPQETTTPVSPKTEEDATPTRKKSSAKWSSKCLPIFKGPLLMSWVMALLALAFFILTALYAFRSTVASNVQIIGSSPSRPTTVLRVLSELVAIFLAGTISGVFERLQHMFVSYRRSGLRLTDYLGLDAGTGIFGLLGIFLRREGQRFPTRVWSAIRLSAMALVPVLSVLIMSKSPFSAFEETSLLLSFSNINPCICLKAHI